VVTSTPFAICFIAVHYLWFLVRDPTMPDSRGSINVEKAEQARQRKTASSADRKADISRSTLKQRIVAGDNLVIYNDQVLDLTRWADKHPGGKLAILHFVGRDATDEMNAYHSEQDIKRFAGFVCGRIEKSVSCILRPVEHI
jgi:hypothetical protein